MRGRASGAGGRTAAIVATAALLLAPPTVGAAQQAPEDAERGWIGVGLRETVVCPPSARRAGQTDRDGCRGVLVVEAVFRSSPAERAGLAPGDTLIEVDGDRLDAGAAIERLRELAPGRTAELLVGREEGRAAVSVTPEARRRTPGAAALRLDRPGARGPVTVRVRAPAVASPDEEVLSIELSELPEPLAGVGETTGIRVDDQGRVFLLRGEEELVRLRRLEEIAPRLRAIQDSAFEAAREKIRAVRAELRREAPPEAPETSRAWTARPPGPHRALGAELWTVTPEMARSLRNVEHGLLVLEVLPRTPAAQVGLRSGDVVVRIGERSVRDAEDLRRAFDGGDRQRRPLAVTWIRGGEAMIDSLRPGR